MLPPTLITKRLTLRQLSPGDAPHIFALRSDNDINKYLDRPTCQTMEQAGSFINKVVEQEMMYWAVTWTESGAFAGTVCLFGFSDPPEYFPADRAKICEISAEISEICGETNIPGNAFSDTDNKCEIGFELLSHFQGKGIMKEAAGKVMEYALQTLQIRVIEAFTHKNNQRSIQLLEKLGFKKSIHPDETNLDYYVY